MLIANETVAEEYFWMELPFLYRTHETPDDDRIQKLRVFIRNFGYNVKLSNDEVHPKELQKLLDKIAGSDEELLISRLTLRSMKQAKYTTTCDGHFGLAAKYYTHFTSPIRRYPDLQIHRIIKENLHGKLNDKRIQHYQTRTLPFVGVKAGLISTGRAMVFSPACALTVYFPGSRPFRSSLTRPFSPISALRLIFPAE